VVEDFGTSKIRDVSMDGIGILMTHQVAVGSLLVIIISNPAQKALQTVLVPWCT